MMFSRSSQYGVKATIFIASRSMDGARAGLKDIAQAIASPEAFTAKIVQSLVKHGHIDSAKGPNGGYYIAPEKLKSLTLGEIILSIDGPTIATACALGLESCDAEHPCPIHPKYKVVREHLNTMLETTRIDDLVQGFMDERSVLKL